LTVPKLLKQAGYATACFGKYGLGKPKSENDPKVKGFDEFFGYVDTSHAHNFYPAFLLRNGERVPLQNSQIPDSGKGGHEGKGVATLEGRKQWAPGGHLQLRDRVHGAVCRTRKADERYVQRRESFFR
jgi:arylsulfatase A-like enzyme